MFLNFFEDALQHRFDPLTLTRPLDDLRVGILTLREKWLRALETDQWSRTTRDHLTDVFGQTYQDQEALWINPRYLPVQGLINQIKQLDQDQAIVEDNVVIAAKSASLQSDQVLETGELPDHIEQIEVTDLKQLTVLRHVWDLFLYNGDQIAADIERLTPKTVADLPDSLMVDDPKYIYLDPSANIEPGVTIITEGKPVYIGPNAHVMAGSVLRGPIAVCEDAVIKMGAKIYGQTTIGPVCKVGGEINNCIFHSYSNKGHDGFVGNSLFGQWCNLGADTNTSNLKNNYSTVGVADWATGDIADSGQQFVGTIMGDHSKTSINTMLNTGTVCGVSCNIFSSGFPPKFIPSFSWLGDGGRQQYRFDKATETMERMMARRDVPFTPEYQRMMQQVLVMGSRRRTTDD
jgi:UDP-N-acetylglucosamine diphosphorylase/glucosamine-1-phosphate N-acetyltransferase